MCYTLFIRKCYTLFIHKCSCLSVSQYTMLSGRAPFQDQQQEDTADNIMKKIRGGEFSMSGPEWQAVSDSAKDLIQGLLTVEPSKRLGMAELVKHPWLQPNAPVAQTPLRTPGVLSTCSAAVNSQLSATWEAFNLATRQGLRLLDVSSAPLAKRRKLKKNSADNRSSSTDSNNSASTGSSGGVAQSPVRQSPVRTFSNTSCASSGSGASTGFVPSRTSPYQRNADIGVSPLATRTSDSIIVNETCLAASVEVVDSQDSDVAVIPSTSSSVDGPAEVLGPHGSKRKLDMRYNEDEEDDEDEDDDCVIVGSSNPFVSQSSPSNNNNKRVKVLRNSTDTIVIDD